MSLISKIEELARSPYRFLLLAGVSLLAILPTVACGVYKGVDLAQHIQFSDTFYRALAAGDFYPSWAASENLGYGGVGVRFYPPLTPFLFALAAQATGSWHAATCLVFFLFSFAGALGVYCWAREFFASPAESVLAGAVFAVMPYHLYQIQNGSQFAEYAGCSVIPFAFLFVTRVCRRGRWADVLGLAVAFAVLVLTHLPTTVIGSLSLLVYTLFSLDKARLVSGISKLAAAALLALAASAAYWLKFVTEMRWLRNTQYSNDHFYDYAHNFLLTADWFGEKQLWFINFMFLTLTAIFAACLAAVLRAGELRKYRAPLALLVFALLMCVAVSKPLWMTIPFLAEVQFPWRWLTIVSAAGAIFLVAALKPLANLARSRANLAQGFAAAVLLGVLAVYALMWSEFSLNHVPAREYGAFVAEQSAALGGEWFWTSTAKEEAFKVREQVSAGTRRTETGAWQPTERFFTVGEGEPVRARVATLYYPHWKASVNGVSVEPQAGADGALLIDVPGEKSVVRLWFEEPRKIVAARYVSLSTWLAFAAAAIFLLIRRKVRDFRK